jgi:hypothetical protein
MTSITTSPWLGTRKDAWSPEMFPEGTLNERQIRALLRIEEGHRRVQDLSHTGKAIFKITDEITEIWTEFGGSWPHTCRLVLWFDQDGNYLAGLEEKYEGPAGVHPPGAKFRKWGVGYLRTPDMRSFDKAEEREYGEFWGLSRDGAVDEVRKFIRETWIADNNDDKE